MFRKAVIKRKYTLKFPHYWIRVQDLDQALKRLGELHSEHIEEVLFQFPAGCKVMVDAGVVLLSLANQLAYSGRNVTLEFEEGMSGVMGYLDRLGFIDLLIPSICTIPVRPCRSSAELYRGSNPGVVEFQRISPNETNNVPSQLTDRLERACATRSDCTILGRAAFTVFGELIDNIDQHCSTSLDGFAALQVYPNGGKALVVVSDSGNGILATLRPSLSSKRLREMTDTELLVEIFNQGLSRHGNTRGCGLRQCAVDALKYKSNLNIRLPDCNVHLVPGADGYSPSIAFCTSSLPEIWGTHIAFEFSLDKND